ncbi:ABC transporter ATP-binding protein [Nocardioides dubius]|uniref:ABC transporter ATP-binding protein n=1 Tax=Nocardioides dubius TaxID=317019 RepID=A0ABN1TZB8_9ACTN
MLLRLLRQYLRPYRTWLTIVVALQFTATLAMLFLPSLNADIIDKGVATGDNDYVLRLGAIMLAVTLAQAGCQMVAAYFAGRASMSFGRDLRAALFTTIGGYSNREVATFGAPSLITRATNDVQQVQMLAMMTCVMGASIPIMMVGGVVMAMREDLGLSWLIVATVPLLILAVGLVVTRMVPAFRAVQERLDGVNRVLREQITGIRVVRAFVREPVERERFAQANDDLTEVAITAGRWMAAMFPIVLTVSNVASVGVIWFGGHRVDGGQMEVGALTAFISYLMQILMSVMMGTFMLMSVPRASVSADRIAEVLNTPSSVVAPAQPVRALSARGHLDLRNVGVTFPGAEAPVLRGVDLTARPGQTVAVIGSTGAGKTTLVNLIPRLLDATAGTVAVDDVDVRDLDPETLWATIGLVPQRAFLFSGTIASNLRHGRPEASDAELWEALEIAQAREFVEALPEQLDTPIAQGGTTVSGGQRQRLAIARAIVRRPEIYLFDDAFSALDVATDARLRAALRPVTAEATVVIVAQRIATIRDADQILVLEDGEVVGRGTHDALLADNETYREIASSQGVEVSNVDRCSTAPLNDDRCSTAPLNDGGRGMA